MNNTFLDLLKEVNTEAAYCVLRGTLTSDGKRMSHDEAKKSLGLSDGQAAMYLAIWEVKL